MHEYLECTEHSDVASVVPCLSRAIRSVTGIGIADLRVSAAGVARKMCMSKPPASTGITGERYALPTQHTTAPTSVADKVLCMETGLGPDIRCVLPRGYKVPLGWRGVMLT